MVSEIYKQLIPYSSRLTSPTYRATHKRNNGDLSSGKYTLISMVFDLKFDAKINLSKRRIIMIK